ncbi:DNA phosphorothioation-dependent restriction protein DptF [Pseudaeromonas paramecii]|uniref:DNA phosphorothioation-dependent restriction protein DptF n=1 Tax=Pseudaeromonas paramecii TaxID=2138166 RepID=A0ABP8PXF9_9GAMM
MSTITLRQALGVLAKSSPFSVSTVSERPRDLYDELKAYLYVEQDIEKDFKKLLTSLRGKEVIFLCGSSGDGKSEILTRAYDTYRHQFHFHLDATHSFQPHQSAIEALDELFDRSSTEQRPLVLGINIGMLANYAKEGAERHHIIREVIERFLQQGDRTYHSESDAAPFERFHFLDFEQYPKFQFQTGERGYSDFVRQLLQRLTCQDDRNLFYLLAKPQLASGDDRQLMANFRLLAMPSVQEEVITNLFKTRLYKDQFITTRALLDLLHHLLLGPGYLFDNLFAGSDNELIARLGEFDPALIHTRALDQFVLRYELDLPDPDLDTFLLTLGELGIVFNPERETAGEAASLIRLFYLLRHQSLGNDYHLAFASEFDEELLRNYADVWLQHSEFDGSNEHKLALRPFYINELIPAVFRYANRNAPELEKGEWFLGQFGTVKLAAPITIKADFARIQREHVEKSSQFQAFLKVADKHALERDLKPITINLNLFALLWRLNRGYRPNKYDKNAIVLLDEMVEQISEVARHSPALRFYEGDRCYSASQDDGMIAVSGVS